MTKEPSPVFGLNSQTLVGADLPTFLALAKENKFSCVEFAGDLLQGDSMAVAQDALESSSLELLGVSPTESVLRWHSPFDQDLTAELFRQMDVAAELGAKYFVLPFTRLPKSQEAVTQALNRTADHAEKIEINLALESIGHVQAFNRVEELAGLIHSMDSSRVGVLLDSFHFFRAAHTLSDLSYLEDLPIYALQISNSNGLPLDQLLGYRDRTFPLDGPFPLLSLVEAVALTRPTIPIVVEIIGDEAGRRPPTESAGLARSHALRIAALLEERKQASV